MYRKLRILQKYCNEYGMKINNEKKKQVCFVISDEGEDFEPFLEGGMTAEFCESYVYLSSPFTCDGSVSSAVKLHARNKLCYVLKFIYLF